MVCVLFLAVTDFFPGLEQNRRITLNVKNSGLSARTILPSLAFMLLDPRANCSVFLRWGRENACSTDVGIIFSFGKFRVKNIVSEATKLIPV